VLRPREKFKKSVERLKGFCSLSEYFGDASFTALNQKNSTSLSLGTQTAFDFLRAASAVVFIPKYSSVARKNLSTYLVLTITPRTRQ
jgi:hypothetical protein